MRDVIIRDVHISIANATTNMSEPVQVGTLYWYSSIQWRRELLHHIRIA